MANRVAPSFWFKEFIPASADVSSTAPITRARGEEIGSFYEELVNTKFEVSVAMSGGTAKPAASARWETVSGTGTGRGICKPAEVSVGYFFQCAQNGDPSGLMRCYEQGIGVDTRDAYSWTALMCAAASGATCAVEFLLEHGADRKVFDKAGVTALRLAHSNGHAETVKLLLDSRWTRPSAVNVKLEKPEPAARGEAGRFCEVCETTIRDSTPDQHVASTVHQFVGRKERPPVSGTPYQIPESNIGFRIMVKEGWNKDEGLGPAGAGVKCPPKTMLKRDRQGLGSGSKTRARVTHFGPKDLNSIKYNRLANSLAQGLPGVSRRERHAKERIEKQKEIDFRRQWHSFD